MVIDAWIRLGDTGFFFKIQTTSGLMECDRE